LIEVGPTIEFRKQALFHLSILDSEYDPDKNESIVHQLAINMISAGDNTIRCK